MTAKDQLHAQMTYIRVREALSELEQIAHRDNMLNCAGGMLSRVENILHNYIGPMRRHDYGEHKTVDRAGD